MAASAAPLFDDLARELDLWAAAGRVARFWWRDDDATGPTPALEKLLGLSDIFAIEVAVAVIPAAAADGLVAAIEPHARTVVLQHGYRHQDHAAGGEPAVECGGARSTDAVLQELAEGRVRLAEMFGPRFQPILAAPWNRIERRVLDRLGETGLRGASAYGSRAAMDGVHGIAIANAHVDPINWKERRFAGLGKALSGMLGELCARRLGKTEPDEPVGLLTHHLDHDADLWRFLDDLFALTTRHGTARWIGVEEAFRPPVQRAAPVAVAS